MYLCKIILTLNLLQIYLIKAKESNEKMRQLEENKILSSDMEFFMGKYYFFTRYSNNILFCAVDIEDEITHQTEALFSLPSTTKPYKTNVTLMIDNKKELTGNEYKEQFSLVYHQKDEILNNFSLVLFDKPNNVEGAISVYAFAHKISNLDYSILHQFYFQNFIQILIVGLEINKTGTGKIYFGGIPDNITSTYTHYLSIPLSNKKSPFWEINIEYIFIEPISYIYTNNYMQTSYPARLSTKGYMTYVPQLVMDYIKEEVFAENLANNTCFNGVDGIYCLCNQTQYLKNFTLIINSKGLLINTNKAFMSVDEICFFEITSNKKNELEWIIGTKILSKFFVAFDYENDNVMLRSIEENFLDIDLDIIFPMKRILKWGAITIIVIVGGILGRMAYVVFQKKRKARLNQFIEENYEKL